MLKSLKHARLTQTHEKELRNLLAVDLLIVDDFGLDAMDTQESRDAHEIITERHRAGSMIVSSNRGPDEWLATFADPMRAQAAIDRFTSNAYDLVSVVIASPWWGGKRAARTSGRARGAGRV